MEKPPIFIALDFTKKLRIFYILFCFLMIFLLWTKIPLSLSEAVGFLLIFLSSLVIFLLWETFLNQKIKKPIYKILLSQALKAGKTADSNLMEYVDFECAKFLTISTDIGEKNKRPLDSLVLASEILKHFKVSFIFNRISLNKKELAVEIKNAIKEKRDGVDFPLILRTAAELAVSRESKDIEIGDFFVAIAQGDPTFQKFISDRKISSKDLWTLVLWEKSQRKQGKMTGKFWDYHNLMRIGSIGRDWASGYTPTLDYFSFSLTNALSGYATGSIGRTEEIETIERVLSKSGENNVIIVGDSDISKKGVLYGFSALVAGGQTMSDINFKRVLVLDFDKVLVGLNTPGEIRLRFNQILSEAVNAGNVILVVEDIHNFMGGGSSLDLDLSGLLFPFLKSSRLQLIALTNFDGYFKVVNSNVSFSSLFEKIEIKEMSPEQSLLIIENMALSLEKKYNIFISYGALKEIIDLSSKFIQDIPFPEKAARLLNEAAIFASKKQEKKLLLQEDIQQIVSGKIEIPLGDLQTEEKEKLKNLEKIMHQRVVNQEKAISGLCEAMRRARAGVSGGKKPIGTFLFLGPTGVGKTETTKALAEAYFGSEKRMIRLDMSEYQQLDSMNRLIGSPDGKEPGFLVTAIRNDPFSLVLLDEIEKAHPNILNLFLQVLDEGRLTDSSGRAVSFLNTIIIGTSNAGAEFIREAVVAGKDQALLKTELLEKLQRDNIFRPEFLNRFDEISVFGPLSKEHLKKIAELMLGSLNKRLSSQGLGISITAELLDKLSELGNNPSFGAREMRRVVQDRVENFVAKKIINGETKRGELVTIDVNNL